MPPIDPYQLLSALSPLLGPQGGMKSTEEVVKLASLMKKFSKKLVSRCVYIQILKATEPDILQKFLDEGGWEIVNTWLKEGKEREDYGFLVELLELYKKLPMTVEKLKENNSARIIKALCKVDNEDMKKVAQEIIGAWMKLVKGDKADQASEKPKKKKRHHDTKPKINTTETETEGALKAPSNQVVPSKKGNLKDKKLSAEKKPAKLNKSLKRTNATEDLEDAKPMVIESEKTLKKPRKGDRPSTVKTYRASFRATGLEDEPSSEKPVSKKGKTAEKPNLILTIKRPAGVSTDIGSPPDKKVKPASLITPADVSKADLANGSINLKAPTVSKPKPVHHVLQDSTGFMDALVAAPLPPVRKKKKVAAKNNEATSPTTPSSANQADAKPQFQFYKDTMESPKEKNSPQIKLTGEGERTPSPQHEKEEHDKENKNKDSEPESASAAENDNNTQSESDLDKSTSKLKEVSTKRKKSVTWAEESVLQEVFYFILDENERVNVNNLKNFGDMKHHELQMEKQAMMNARRLKGDYMEEHIAWYTPPLVANIPVFERGAKSTEKETQRVRQQGVLQFLFLSNKNESPQEPDPETNVVNTNTKIIPLEDDSNQDAIMDYSNFVVPNNGAIINQDLAPALSNLMTTMTQQNMLALPPNDMMQQPQFDQYYDAGLPQGHMDLGGPMMMGAGHPRMMSGQPIPNMGMMRGPRDFPRGPNMRWRGPRGGHRGGPPQRGGGPRRGGGGGPRFPPRNPCRHYMEGSCQFGDSCKFLHPGRNGPPL